MMTLTEFLLARIAEDEAVLHRTKRRQQHRDFCTHDLRGLPFPTLRHMAVPYADHPDYRDEWKP